MTEAGPPRPGCLKGTAGIGTLLAEGIGDTIRYSLTADPVEEARAGRQLLEALGLRERKGLDLIACPSCGRAQVDVIAVAKAAQDGARGPDLPIQVAVMGCVVNGPGEARGADIGIAAGKQKGHLFIRGKIVRVVPEAEMVEALVAEAEKLVAEGVEARLAAADATAEAEAEADRRALGREGRRPQRHRGADRADPRAPGPSTTRRKLTAARGHRLRHRPDGRAPSNLRCHDRRRRGRPAGTASGGAAKGGAARPGRRTSPAGTKRWWPGPSWPTTGRCAAPWSSGPGATPSGSGSRPSSTARIKEAGAENAYFPLFIPESFLTLEAEHVEGFSPELAVVTHGGGKQLEEPVVVRPTSETVINHYFAKWVQSHRDLPAADQPVGQRGALGAAAPPVPADHRVPLAGGPHRPRHRGRRPGLRPADPHRRLPRRRWTRSLPSRCSPATRRPGSGSPGPIRTWTCEGMMGDGKALQMGTSHELGQNFARAFGIQFSDAEGALQYVWQTSWGVSTRLIGALVMAHGDDFGLRLPPALAPGQVVVMVARDGRGGPAGGRGARRRAGGGRASGCSSTTGPTPGSAAGRSTGS